jgi:hypothetical protein
MVKTVSLINWGVKNFKNKKIKDPKAIGFPKVISQPAIFLFASRLHQINKSGMQK